MDSLPYFTSLINSIVALVEGWVWNLGSFIREYIEDTLFQHGRKSEEASDCFCNNLTFLELDYLRDISTCNANDI